MSAVFIDTSFLLALCVSTDAMHDEAISIQKQIRGSLVTTEYVLTEVLDALCSPRGKPLAMGVAKAIREDPNIVLVPASTSLFDEALALYSSRADKSWGLTDCASFVVMQSRGITTALSSDRHFAQAGFHVLLSPSV